MLEISADPVLFTVLIGLIGLNIGSFLNVVIHRLPHMMEREWLQQCAELQGTTFTPTPERYNLAIPRSACPNCGHSITALENIPVISWLCLRGRCSGCKTPISIRYPLVEALTGILSAFVAWHFGPGWMAACAVIFVWALVALTFIDFDTQLLPDEITLPLVWLGLLCNCFGIFTNLQNAVIGAMIGYLSLWSVYWLFRLTTGKEGMGYGDFKLLAAIGAWLGWQMLPATILLSSLVGAIAGIAIMLATRRGKDVPIPFGPYLAGAGFFALIWGQTLTKQYLGLLSF